MLKQPALLRTLGRRPWVRGAALLVIALALAYWMWGRKCDPYRVAQGCMEALYSRDFASAAECALDEERKGGALADELAFVWDELFVPSVKTVELAGDQGEASPMGDSGYMSRNYRMPSGELYGLGVQAFHTEDGCRARMLEPILRAAWFIRYGSAPNYDRVRGDTYRAIIAGIRADAEKLDRQGIHGVYLEPPLEFRTWEEWRVYAEDQLRLIEASPQ